MPVLSDETPVQLFTAADLTTALGRDINDDQGAQAERIVWGWLMRPLGVTDRPSPVPDDVYGWALELGCIWIENPSGLQQYQLSEERIRFSEARRLEILQEVRVSRSATDPASPLRPTAQFPDARPWPDPIRTFPATWDSGR